MLLISMLLQFLAVPIMLFGAAKGVQAMKKKQKEIDFIVQVRCEQCGTQFQIPLHVYGKHLMSKSKTIQVSVLGNGVKRIFSESRKVHCESCQKETYCNWENITEFPNKYRMQLNFEMIKGLAPYMLIAFLYSRFILFLFDFF